MWKDGLAWCKNVRAVMIFWKKECDGGYIGVLVSEGILVREILLYLGRLVTRVISLYIIGINGILELWLPAHDCEH